MVPLQRKEHGMDKFLRDIYISVFKQWILYYTSDDYHIYEKDSQVIAIETAYGRGEVTFSDLGIIELRVINKIDNTAVFYLHFQMRNFKHATELFEEMLETLNGLVVKPKIKVLLSCSSGFTTGFFAEKLNEAAKLLESDYIFDARAYSELFDDAKDFDVILLAPQISYMQPKIMDVLSDKLVLCIPSTMFAGYDVKATFEFIEDELLNHKQKENSSFLPDLELSLQHEEKILCIALIRMKNHVRIAYRVYDKDNQIVLDDEMLKCQVSLRDVSNLIHLILLEQPDISIINISKPGHADLDLALLGSHRDIKNYLSHRFKQAIMITNDANDIALGYYACQNQISSLSFVFQPMIGHNGSVGSVYDGKLIKGKHNVAGEILFSPIRYSNGYDEIKKTPEGAIEWATKNILALISVLGPELILISSPLISNVEELKEEVRKYIPDVYLPEIVKIEGLKEYLLVGQLVQCVNQI